MRTWRFAAAKLANAAALSQSRPIWNTSTNRIEALISAVTFPIFEQIAPCTLTGEADPERALRKLRRLTPHPLCMTLGDRGAVALEGDRFHVAPAFTVSVADNTGAGDAFRAGFIYGLLQGWNVAERLRFANATAALSCTPPAVPFPRCPAWRKCRRCSWNKATR